MKKYIIEGGNRLYGTIDIPSAKNAVLPIIAGCIMTDEEVVIKQCPKLADILSMLRIIEGLGGSHYFAGDELHIKCENVRNSDIDADLTSMLRSSIFALGPILARNKYAKICYPGGCDIGQRPIDFHINGLRALGAVISDKGGMLCCNGEGMAGSSLHLDFPSVGATENLMMAATLAKGTTVIHNAAIEPEIRDLQDFLNAMGGNVNGAGSKSITIVGVKKLHGCQYTPIADRITAGTYMIACGMCGGEITVSGVDSSHLYLLSSKLREAGCHIEERLHSIDVASDGDLIALKKTETRPYPGYPTDLQSQLIAMLCTCSGTSLVEENLFENRFHHVCQLKKMGGDIMINGKLAVITGVPMLHGGSVEAEDLRGGASLVLAGLRAEGRTVVSGVRHIERGYYELDKQLSNLGANIRLENQ